MDDDEDFSRSPVTADAADNDEDFPEPSNGRITVTLALPIQNQRSTPSSGAAAVGSGGGGGREDCWSEEATAALIEAWGERYSEQSRGILKQKHWEEVAEIVNARAGAGAGKPARTDVQCKNRMDTVKRKYKSEKAKIASGAGPSAWIFFDHLDRLLGNPNSASAAKFSLPPTSKQPIPQRSHGFLLRAKRPVSLAEDYDFDSDSSDSLPPATHHNQRTIKRQKIDFDSPPSPPPPRPPRFDGGGRTAAGAVSGEGQGRVNEWRNSVRELTRVIFMFSQAYEQAESEKLQQMVEMEKQRMKFAKELEIQRMKFLMKTQLQLSRLSRVGQQDRHVSDENDNNNVNNNSDCSN